MSIREIVELATEVAAWGLFCGVVAAVTAIGWFVFS